MPRPRKVPSYCRHKARDLAYVTIDGREIYLGRYGSPESKEKYARIIAERFPTGVANGKPQPVASASSITVNELILRYWQEYVEKTYVKDGKLSERQYPIRVALRPLKALYGETLAAEFGPRSLRLVREKMIDDGVDRRGGLNRKYVNEHIGTIKRMFRWAVSEELIDVTVYQSLMALENIRKGRDTRVTESRKVLPAPEEHIKAVLEHVSPQIGAMIQIQCLTGMRPDEVTIMRPRDIDRSGDVWMYTPESHKLDFRDIEKHVPLGPKAQVILSPWLDRDRNAYLFDPREVVAAQLAARRNDGRKKKRTKPAMRTTRRRSPRDHYDDESYCQAVERACKKAQVPKWTPGQLRHNAATKLRQKYGIEAARLILGHQSASTTEIYAEQNRNQAIEIMREVG